MTDAPSAARHAPVRAMVSVLLPLDLATLAASAILWVITDLGQLWFILFVHALRLPAWIEYGRRVLAPAGVFVDHGALCRDDQLLAADAAMQDLGPRVAKFYVLTWFGAALLWIGVGWSERFAPSYAGAELLASAMFACALLCALSLAQMLLDGSSRELRIEISKELQARRLDPRRRDRMLLGAVTNMAIQMWLGAVIAIGGLGLLWGSAGQRDAAVARQARDAQLSALRIDRGLAPVSETVEIVASEAEGTCTAGKLGPDPVAVYDAECGLAVATAPLADGRWVVTTEVPDEHLWMFALMLFVVVVASAPTFSLGFTVFTKSITAPLERFGAIADRFVEAGELQGLERFVPLRNDELGRLATRFNAMLDLLEELANAAEAVASGDLTVEFGHEGDLHESFRAMIEQLGEAARRMRETSLELGGAAQEIGALMQEQGAAARAQSTGIKQLSARVGSLASSAQDIATAAAEVQRDADRSLETTRIASEELEQLREHARSVTELLELIHEIADRSDLLALNGALEATRAGDAGRGFALVAAEMRGLAERVTGTVDDVRARLVAIERSSTSTVAATQASRELVQRTAEAARGISTITANQSDDTREASEGVRAFADLVMRSAAAVHQTQAAAAGIGEYAAELAQLMAQFKLREDVEGEANDQVDQVMR